MLPMLSSDRAILRNLVIVVLASSGAAVLLGMSCLNRGMMSQGPDSASIRSSAGGIPQYPAGTTSITSLDMPPPGQPGPMTNRPMPRPQYNGAPPDRQPDVAPRAPPGAMRDGMPPPPMYNQNGVPYGRPPNPPSVQATPDGAASMPPNMVPPNAVPPQMPANLDAGPTAQQPPPPPRFATEAPPWAASNYQSNPEAGAGQFIDTPQPR
jgi:hypothetical protein